MDPANIQLVAFLRDYLDSDEEPSYQQIICTKDCETNFASKWRGLKWSQQKKTFYCKLKKGMQARSHVRRNSVTSASKHAEVKQIKEDMKKEFTRKTKVSGINACTVQGVS